MNRKWLSLGLICVLGLFCRNLTAEINTNTWVWTQSTIPQGTTNDIVIPDAVTSIIMYGTVTVNGTLNIRLADDVAHHVTISNATRDLGFSIGSSGSLNIQGKNREVRIIFDGGADYSVFPALEGENIHCLTNSTALVSPNSRSQSVAFCSVLGLTAFEHVTIRNFKQTQPTMSAVFNLVAQNAQAKKAKIVLVDTIIEKCYANVGPAVFVGSGCGGLISMTDCLIRYCVAKSDQSATSWGGIIRSWGDSTPSLYMTNSVMTQNYTHWNGGAICWNASSATTNVFDGCEFSYNFNDTKKSDNTGTYQNRWGGGGAMLTAGTARFEGNVTKIHHNRVPWGFGGGICFYGYSGNSYVTGPIEIDTELSKSLHVYDNYALYGGGVAYRFEGVSNQESHFNINLDGAQIRNNHAGESGGGILVTGNDLKKASFAAKVNLNFTESQISDNVSDGIGGGVCVEAGNVNINGGSIDDNAAGKSGGGLFLGNTTITFTAGTVENNVAADGGGIYVTNGLLSATGGSIVSNAAVRGGGMCLGVDGKAAFDGTINVCYNVATNLGGGVAMNYNSILSITNGTFAFNQAQMGGGAHLLGGAKLTIIGGDFFCNRAVYREGTDLVHDGNTGKTNSTNWPTAWHTERYDLCSGVGGGIYLGAGNAKQLTTLDCPKNDRVGIVGAYSNTADRAGNEIVSAGLYTKVNLPNRVLTNEVGQILTWFEDYYTSQDGTSVHDTHYRDRWAGAPVGTGESMRYMVARLTGRQQHVSETTAETEGSYLCLALGYGVDSPVRSLWITDHADAGTFDGTNWVNLAFAPVFDGTNKVRVADWFLRAKARGWIKYATALDEASFADASLMTDFRYRDGHGTNDIDKGWVWLTIPVSDERPASTNRLWKIYVDDSVELGGVQLWENGPYFAECNVGAWQPEESGYYFWWGDKIGYKHEGGKWVSVTDGQTIEFKSGDSTANQTYQKTPKSLYDNGYIDENSENGKLTREHDAATVYLGAPWRMMTKADLDALVANCTTEWTNNWNGTGINGHVAKGKGDYASKSVFFPAAGYGKGANITDAGKTGCYWTSAYSTRTGNYNAWLLYVTETVFTATEGNEFDSANAGRRYRGFMLRPVRDAAK